VTFSAAQQLLVEDLLDEERRRDPALDRFFIRSDDCSEPVFVKNLENVQGDERDVILFSICYGPDESGRVGMNFGPINQQGGERRLNVAVTRARRELVVFSTLTADQIDLARTRSRGVADLKLFLSYAQHGLRVLPEEATSSTGQDDFDSPLEKEICEALRAKGYTVQSQVGCSGYRIDLAVVDPDVPGRFLVGIEFDGANYHSARTARDRDHLRQSVLTGLGWKLLRVWSSDWWESRDEQLERLCTAIEDARRTARFPPPPPPPPPPASAPSGAESREGDASASDLEGAASALPQAAPSVQRPPEDGEVPVYRARPQEHLGSQEDFHDPAQSGRVQAELEAVVREEGPISLNLAAARVAACFGFERTRGKAVLWIDEIARRARVERTEQATGAVLWPASAVPGEWRAYRRSEPGDLDARASADLPVQEIANAAEHLLTVNGACPRRDLQRALSRIFGFKALGGTVAAHLDSGIEHLIAAGRARLGPDGRVEPAP
jgi:very-short-patch-repair endonuclease